MYLSANILDRRCMYYQSTFPHSQY